MICVSLGTLLLWLHPVESEEYLGNVRNTLVWYGVSWEVLSSVKEEVICLSLGTHLLWLHLFESEEYLGNLMNTFGLVWSIL